MPKESENELLRQMGGKALNQMHSSCAKKMLPSRLKEASEFDILSNLKELSDRADKLGEQKLSVNPGLSEWFAAIKKRMEEIRDCENVKDLEPLPSIKTFTGLKEKNEKAPDSEPVSSLKLKTPIPKELMHEKVTVSSPLKMTPVVKETPVANPDTVSNSQMVTPATNIRKKVNPFVLLNHLTDQRADIKSNENSFKTNHLKHQSIVQTPVLNRTFEKINTTMVLNSGSSTNNTEKSTVIITSEDSGIKTRSGAKKKPLKDSNKIETERNNSHGMLTRSGSKRKSSATKNDSNKKQKVDSQNISSATLKKNGQTRHPLRDLKITENKTKISAVIKPSMQPQKQPVVSKEQQILEEIKKKEKKLEENRQRLMAERQQKAEQIKKNREEKQTRTLQKRLQMEKEKEEKLKMEAKTSQAKANKENPKKIRPKEVVEQHVKESKSSIITSKVPSTSNNSDNLVKTPANRKSEDIQSYELTPLPDSSTYNFSDDEDDKPPSNKHIPRWATGVYLKNALMQQYYNPINTDELFGSVIETPDLVDIFKVNKKRYFKRTSSAIWNSPPDRILHH